MENLIPKFKMNDIVKHKSVEKGNAIKMLIVAWGLLTDDKTTDIIYRVSFQRPMYAGTDNNFAGSIFNENEIELID